VITDGQLSGLNRGIAVGQISPEAAMGGLIWLVEDGGQHLHRHRQAQCDPGSGPGSNRGAARTRRRVSTADEHGWLSIYARTVGPMEQGAVLLKSDR